jgi:hypothetical protein
MGDLEIIKADGLRLRFEQNGVVPDIVPLSECCELCNDPRMVHVEGLLKCVGCGVINRIDYGHHS